MCNAVPLVGLLRLTQEIFYILTGSFRLLYTVESSKMMFPINYLVYSVDYLYVYQ